MKHQCKITVLETKVFPDLQENILLIRSLDHVRVLKMVSFAVKRGMQLVAMYILRCREDPSCTAGQMTNA